MKTLYLIIPFAPLVDNARLWDLYSSHYASKGEKLPEWAEQLFNRYYMAAYLREVGGERRSVDAHREGEGRGLPGAAVPHLHPELAEGVRPGVGRADLDVCHVSGDTRQLFSTTIRAARPSMTVPEICSIRRRTLRRLKKLPVT